MSESGAPGASVRAAASPGAADAYQRAGHGRWPRWPRRRMSTTHDLAAVEEPLEVRLHGQPFAVIMRTPGDDRALAAGFLLSEGVVRTRRRSRRRRTLPASRSSRRSQRRRRLPARRGQGRRSTTILAERRNVLTNSSCGLCGRLTIDSLKTRAAPLRDDVDDDDEGRHGLPDRLRERQRVFEGTGGLHAAGLFTPDGMCERRRKMSAATMPSTR